MLSFSIHDDNLSSQYYTCTTQKSNNDFSQESNRKCMATSQDKFACTQPNL
ncbi:hypothetical protein X975_05989, partial [Stegodyphus mimosarum]